MPDPSTSQRLKGLILSAAELSNMTQWPSELIEDYLTLFENLILLADTLDIEIDQKIEEIDTDFADGTIPFAEDGHLVVDAIRLLWDSVNKALTIEGDIKGKNRAKQYFFAGF